jgi:hypothetical protein
MDGVEGKVGLGSRGEAQDEKAKEGVLSALKYMSEAHVSIFLPSFLSSIVFFLRHSTTPFLPSFLQFLICIGL